MEESKRLLILSKRNEQRKRLKGRNSTRWNNDSWKGLLETNV